MSGVAKDAPNGFPSSVLLSSGCWRGAMGSIMLVWNSGKKSVIFDCFEVFDVAGGGICRFVELSDDAELVLERKGSNKRGNGGWVRKGSIVFVGGAGK